MVFGNHRTNFIDKTKEHVSKATNAGNNEMFFFGNQK